MTGSGWDPGVICSRHRSTSHTDTGRNLSAGPVIWDFRQKDRLWFYSLRHDSSNVSAIKEGT